MLNFTKGTVRSLLKEGILSEVQDGNHGELHPKADDFVEDGIPFVMASDIAGGKIDFEKCNKIPASIYKKLRIGFSRGGDVLLSHKASIGFTALVPEGREVMLTPQVTYYRIKNKEKLSNKFLYYWFQSPLFQKSIKNLSAQSTRSYIGILAQKELPVNYPIDVKIQKKIVSILDSVEFCIFQTEETISKLQKIKTGIMQDLFTRGVDTNGKLRPSFQENPKLYQKTKFGMIPVGWEIDLLENVATKIQDGTHFSPASTKGEYKYITSKNIRFGYLDLTDLSYISEKEHKVIYARCDVKEGDILLTKDGANTGNVAINTLVEPFSMLSSVALVRCDEKRSHNRFILQYFMTSNFQKFVKDSMSGNAITRITLTIIRNVQIPIPPLNEQISIANVLTSIDSDIVAEELTLQKMKNLKRGFMNDLLTGKVEVKVDEDE